MPPRPPAEVFCLHCGPVAVLRRLAGPALRCPRCGDERTVPANHLFVVTGASGAGKTTIAGLLHCRLPTCDVFDTDVILQIAALGWDVWRNTWLQLAHAVGLNGRVTVLFGSLVPDQLQDLPARKLIGSIHFCNLDCADAVLADRLRSRPSWRGSSTQSAIAHHQRFAGWLREHIQPCIDTSLLSPDQTADRIATWIRDELTQADPSPPAAD